MDRFDRLDLDERILRAVQEEGYEEPTEVQRGAIPPALKGRDVLGIAQTGTGKTAAFSLPILHRLAGPSRPKRRPIRALVLTPTRELALQVHESFRTYGRHLPLRSVVVLGGVGQKPQVDALRKGADILVATPGRLLDLMGQGHVSLEDIEIFVLDEADRMLDMGFIRDVRRVVDVLPEERQTLFFSATMPPEVSHLAEELLVDSVRIEVAPPSTVARRIDQRVFFVDRTDKNALLAELLASPDAERVLVFARTKHRANRVAKYLDRSGVEAEVIHSNKTQGARQRALTDFASGRARVLVGTDIVARGIDVERVTHVINYDVPDEPESYVHRIGRTARAGEVGAAFTFCDADEIGKLAAIEVLTERRLHEEKSHRYRSEEIFLDHEDELRELQARRGRRPKKRTSGKKKREFSGPPQKKRSRASDPSVSAPGKARSKRGKRGKRSSSPRSEDSASSRPPRRSSKRRRR